MKIDETSSQWFSVALPSSQQPAASAVNVKPPPDTIRTGEELAFQPALGRPAGVFILKNGPTGMRVDPKTGKIMWKAEVTSLGRWDVEIVDRYTDKEKSVLKFTLRVQQ